MKNKSRIARLALAAVMGAAALSAQAATYEYDATALAAASGDETTFTYDSEGRIVSLTFSGGGTDDTAFTGDMTFAPDAAIKLSGKGTRRLVLNGAMNYGKLSSASTVLEEGVWRLAASSVTHDDLAFTVAGGTLAAAADTANALGVLTVASSGGLSVGEGASLAFADSSGATWDVGSDVKLSIAAASGASVRFGTSASGLTDAQLRRVRLNGKRVILDENGYVQLRTGSLLIIR